MLSNRNLPLCTYRDITPVYPLRMAVKTTDKTMHIHCINVYTLCIYMYIHCTWVQRIVCIYHYCWWPTLFLQHLAWHKNYHHLVDRDCPHPCCSVHQRAEGYPWVLHLHLCVCLENLLRQLVIPCTYIIYTCTYIVHTCRYSVYTCTYNTFVPLRHFPLLSLYSLHEVLCHASVQESAVLYMQCSHAYIHLKNACGILPFSCTDITVHGLSMYLV